MGVGLNKFSSSHSFSGRLTLFFLLKVQLFYMEVVLACVPTLIILPEIKKIKKK